MNIYIMHIEYMYEIYMKYLLYIYIIYTFDIYNVRSENVLNQELKQMHRFWFQLKQFDALELGNETWETGLDFLSASGYIKRTTTTTKLEQFILKIACLLHVKTIFFKRIMFTSRNLSYIFSFEIS